MIKVFNELTPREQENECDQIYYDLCDDIGQTVVNGTEVKNIMPCKDATDCATGQTVVMLSTELPMVGVIKDRLGNDVTVESGGKTYNGNNLYMTALH